MNKRTIALKKLLENFNQQNLASLKQILKETQQELRKHKNQHFQNIANSLNSQTPIKKVWQIIKTFNNKQQTSNKINERTSIKLSEAMDKLSPPDNTNNNTKIKISENAGQDFIRSIWLPTNYEEINSIIHKSKSHTAPGSDGISNQTIKNLPKPAITKLTKIFNTMLQTGNIPQEWKKFEICLIPKPGNTGFRPIALSQCLMKIFEKIIMNRLEYFVETEYLLPTTQFGFRKGKSCSDNLAILTTDSYNAFAQGKEIGLLLLDIEGAYDNIIPQLLINNLEELRIPKQIIKLIANLVEERHANFYFNGELLETRKIRKGVPQGCVTSPILFNLYLRKIEQKINEKCRIVQFADDIALYSIGRDPNEIIENLETSINRLEPWLRSLGLNISTKKTKFMMLSRKKNSNENITIKVKNQQIKRSQSARFLGVTLDSKLTWKEHIKNTETSVNKCISALKTLTRTTWGGEINTLLRIHKSLIRAKMEYAFMCAGSACKTAQQILEQTQYNSLRTILGVYRSTPTNILLDLASMTSFQIRAEELTRRYLTRSYSQSSHKIIPKQIFTENLRKKKKTIPNYCNHQLYNSWTKIKDDLQILKKRDLLPCFEIPLQPQLESIDINLDTGKDIKRGKINANFYSTKIQSIYPNYIEIYTDGSKRTNNECGGLAIVSPSLKTEKLYKIDKKANIFEIESMAIIMALKLIKDSQRIQKVIINSDSMGTLTALKDVGINAKAHPHILEIKSLISRCTRGGKKITLSWCPGHMGIQGNEEANTAANRAIKDGSLINNFQIEAKSLYKKWKHSAIERNKHELKKTFQKKGRNYGLYANLGNQKPWFLSTSLSRADSTLINRIRSGHVNTKIYLKRIGKIPEDICDCGKSPQSLNHIFWNCELTKEETKKLSNFLINKKILPPWEITSLSFTEDDEIRREITKFANKIRPVINITHIPIEEE
uniref:Reverse transcriptase domain-containing protein n=1 Tax=Bracon brevicornis TaxID=1563983 RepID=A0A6V7LYK6_9HYME